MKHRLVMLVCGVLVLAGPRAAFADTPRELVRQGNEHYAAQRYAAALKCYQQAEAGLAQPSAELLHDLAAAHFKLGQLDEARDLWVRAKAAPDAAFEARSRYNLGNCAYAEALAAAPQNGQQALAQLAEAAEQYQAAVRLDPALADARANLELTQLLKRQIEEQQQNQSQSQPSSAPSKQDQKDKQQQQQSSTQPSQSDQREQSQQDKQNEQQKREESATSQPSEDQQNPQDQPQDQQQQKSEDQQQSPESQPSATPETMPAETQPADPNQTGNASTTIRLTREQAERLLQMIRDAEKVRREKLAAERVAKQKPVERDW